jgi:hypothetical protein
MKRLPHMLTAGLCCALLAGMWGCEPDASPRAKEAATWLIAFYNHYAIRGGWGIFGVEAHGENVEIAVNIPNTQADDLMKFDENKRMRFIAFNACPPPAEQVWSTLELQGDVIIQARSKGNVFATVPCRANNKGNPL